MTSAAWFLMSHKGRCKSIVTNNTAAAAANLCQHVLCEAWVPLKQVGGLQVVLALLVDPDGFMQLLLCLCRIFCSQPLCLLLTALSSSSKVACQFASFHSNLVVAKLPE